ncbi:MAG: uracil phosphoribosyltransferase [Malacoplasma sp.]|nr:uracil phosphoribosyltransferase [Malacoplasma sp.]
MVKLIKHPLINIKLSRMRNKNTDYRDFKSNLKQLSQFMAYELTKNLKTKTIRIQTPLCGTNGFTFDRHVVLVPILRAGLGMVEGFAEMIPQAKTGFIGMFRNEKTLKPVEYYCKMPDCISKSDVIIVDPMLATGNSLVAAVKLIQDQYKPHSISCACVVAAPEGIKAVEKAIPKTKVFVCAIDKCLNKNGYIVPGLGDAGDRIFGTK